MRTSRPTASPDTPAPEAAAAALTEPELNGITRMSAVDTVRARISLAIDLDLMAAGEKLPPDAQIAAALDVSEITVRRALETMAEDGTVERRRGRSGGTFVTGVRPSVPDGAVEAYRADAALVHRLIDLRTLLECALTHHAAVHASTGELAQLAQHVADAGAAENWTEYHWADERFHVGVAEASGLTWALEQYREVLSQLYRYFIPYPIDVLHAANEDHARIVAALEARDPVAAVDMAREHVQHLHSTMFVGRLEGGTPPSGARGHDA
ncbi:FadR/GntR family transcriptional regulator [Agromyces sp. Soil535]|uniref:FadR/GntR family transcriptional regulator n=1 Tax=Agromyces sp. Soil535 TaxID=1736390 RepID=UPI000B0C64F3|nr:FCD domain-containing protein [Agromyces sp. Soil535]